MSFHLDKQQAHAMAQLQHRPRRNRKSHSLREILKETELSSKDLVLPQFILPGKGEKQAIASMPEFFRLSVDEAVKQAKQAFELGIRAIALFPVIPDEQKDSMASSSVDSSGLMPTAITAIKDALPEMVVITDVALDPYSSDGHDGLVKDGRILNDETLEVLAMMALTQAQAGADIVAPSDMMDGRTGYIRSALDQNGFTDTGILSYAAKYASGFYGPFRDALDSTPRFGDKKTYQMDPANHEEALLEVALDIEQGADIIMVKPGLPYLDVIWHLKQEFTTPIAAYNVSGEYSMLMAAAKNGWLDEKTVALESLVSLKRAGASMVFSYFALKAAQWLQE